MREQPIFGLFTEIMEIAVIMLLTSSMLLQTDKIFHDIFMSTLYFHFWSEFWMKSAKKPRK